MRLSSIAIQNVRRISDALLQTFEQCNVVYGENGESFHENGQVTHANKPYEPPSLGALLGLTASGSERLDEKELIDPLAESQRLQREGMTAPVDPNAAAPKGEEAKRESATSYYPATGRPQNKIVYEGTGPAN